LRQRGGGRQQVTVGDAEQAKNRMLNHTAFYGTEIASLITNNGILLNYDPRNSRSASYLPSSIYNSSQVRILGIIHTHPRNTLKLSSADFNASQKLGVPNFILTPNGYSSYGIRTKLPLNIDFTSPVIFQNNFDPYDFIGK